VLHFCADIPYLLVGIRNPEPGTVDLVTSEEARKVAEQIKAYMYLECTLRSGEGINEVFEHAARAALLYHSRKKPTLLGKLWKGVAGKGKEKAHDKDTKLAELIRQDPGFDVNMGLERDESTLLHYACRDNSRSAVITLLLVHPEIDVNVKNIYGETPFYLACRFGHISCVRELLKDSSENVNEPDNRTHTPLWRAAVNDHLEVIKWWIASGRDGSWDTRRCLQDGSHWGSKEKRQHKSCVPAGEIQE